MPMIHCLRVLMTVTLICAAPAHAQIYKWIDANGMTHYSDKAPRTKPSKIINLGKPKKVTRARRVASNPIRHTAASLPKPVKSLPQRSEEKPDLLADTYEVKAPIKKTIIRDIKQKSCDEKRMELAAVREKGFNAYYDEEGHFRLAWGADGIYLGKRRFLNDEDIAKRTAKVMFEVEQYCDHPYDHKHQETARANWIRSEYCTLSKAVLEDLEHPFMRSTDEHIRRQQEEVNRFCTELAPGQHRNDERYYPKTLLPKAVLPRYLTLK